MLKKAWWICLILVLVVRTPAAAQDDWNRYRPGSLSAVADRLRSDLLLRGDTLGMGTVIAPSVDMATRAVVLYTGEVRSLTENAARVLRGWRESVGLGEEVLALFQREVHFRDGARDFWVPVPEVLIGLLEEEVGPGNALAIYVLWIGAARNGGRLESIFLANEFDDLVLPRDVDLGSNGVLALGEVPVGIDLGDRDGAVLRLHAGTFSGAEAVSAEIGAGERVRAIHFAYPRNATFEAYITAAEAALGVPLERTTTGLPRDVLEAARWQDRATTAVLEKFSADGETRLRFRLIDRN